MSEQENLNTIRNVYQKWNDSSAESVDLWIGLLDDNIKFKSLANGAPGMEFTAACESKGDVINYLQALVEDWEMIHYTVKEYVCQGDRVVAIGDCGWKHRKTGKSIESPKVDIIRMRDGKITEFFELYDTAQALAAAH